jgi:predicted nucleotide-binding protein
MPAWSGSNIGYHARVYYTDFKAPPPGDGWSSEWGRFGMFASSQNWKEYPAAEVMDYLLSEAGNPDVPQLRKEAAEVRQSVQDVQAEVQSIFTTLELDAYLLSIQKTVDELPMPRAADLKQSFPPRFRNFTTRDVAAEMRIEVAPHQDLAMIVAEIRSPTEAARTLRTALLRAADHMDRTAARPDPTTRVGSKVFIGHGRSHDWRILKDFIVDRAGLDYDEFNRVAVAGISTTSRLSEMLEHASIAFLVLSAEDERADGTVAARQNVIHEVGLFQGRLGWDRAIVLLEEGCEEFSNIAGLGQLRYPVGNIQAKFEEVRQILEREQLI